MDHIEGVVFSKDILEWVDIPKASRHEESAQGAVEVSLSKPKVTTAYSISAFEHASMVMFVVQMKKEWGAVTAFDLMQPTYFIPETMSTWKALQALQRRRIHLAIVVDEYGG